MSSDEREDHKNDKRRWHPLSLTPNAILIQEECIKFTLLLLNCGGWETRDIAPQSKVTERLYTFCVRRPQTFPSLSRLNKNAT